MDQWQYAWQLDGQTRLGAVQALLERLEWEVGGDVGYLEDQDRQFGLNIYRNKVQDLIQWAPTGASGNWQPSNIARADLRGLGLSWRQSLGNFGIKASLDWQNPEDTVTGKRLILRSREHASLGLDHALGDWTWSADWQLQGERYNDAENTVRLGGYGLLHLSAAHELTREWSVQARLENALDKDYERSSGYNTPGRNLFVSLRYQPR
jgi:vitamin B12 transporter